jgi:hypothetical protein
VNDPTADSRTKPRPGGFSLASLALLVTAAAVLLVSLDMERCYSQLAQLGERQPRYLIGLVGGAIVFGALVGFARLFLEGFSWLRLVLALVGGCLAGMVAVLIVVSPGPFWRVGLAVGLLLVITNLLRLDAE